MGRRAALTVLCVASFLAVVDTTIVTIALPSIRRSLAFTPGGAHSGLASGLVNTATQLGGGIGLALVATVVAANLPGARVNAAALGAGFVACLVVVAAALIVVTTGVRSPRH